MNFLRGCSGLCGSPQAELESGIAEVENLLQLSVGRAPAVFGYGRSQFGLLVSREAEFDARPRDVPADVLTADEIMAAAVIECVRLEELPCSFAQPFPAMEPIVGIDRQDRRMKALRISEPAFEA
nr:hypothetical protein [Sinorhizobium medicae]